MRVLVAVADPTTRALLGRIIGEWGHSVGSAAHADEVAAALAGFEPTDVALLDWSLPGEEGPELVHRLAAQEPPVYVLVLGAGPDALAAGLAAGADDVLGLPLDIGQLAPRLRGAARVVRLRADLDEAREALRELALRDSLTGLFNRKAMMDGLDRELQRSARSGAPVSVLVFDIDHFRIVNATYGQFVGDAVLREVAARCQAALRPYDSVGRIGGEEFMVVLPGVGVDLTGILAERVRLALAATPIGLPDGRIVVVTMSVGAAGGPAPSVGDADGLYRAAEAALVRAKAAGRNRVERAPAFDPSAS